MLHCSNLTIFNYFTNNLLKLCLINPLIITILIKPDKKKAVFLCATAADLHEYHPSHWMLCNLSSLGLLVSVHPLTFFVFSSLLPTDHQKLEREARICRLLKHPNIGNYLNWKADVSFKEQ